MTEPSTKTFAPHLHEAGASAPPSLAPASANIRPRELARLLGISVRTLIRWRQQGRLPRSLPAYGQVHWRRSEITRWIACGMPRLENWEAMNATNRRATP